MRSLTVCGVTFEADVKLAGRIAVWPHATGLDVAAIAFLWQRIAADVGGVHVPLAASALLAATVWGIYLLDRVWDVRRAKTPLPALRHRLAAKHPKLWTITGVAALGASAAFAPSVLSSGGLVASMAVAVLCAEYYAGRIRWGERWPEPMRAAVLAGIFTAGCLAVPLAVAPTSAALLGVGLSLLLVLSANALECMRAEAGPRGRRTGNAFLGPAVGSGILIAIVLRMPDVLMAAGALVLVHQFGPRRTPDTHAAMADAALLMPLLFRL
ncbi:MAG: hypothetical protein SFU53_07540 [Terrimicrobiaceae bacterium]|nr:hypothetical protein [Terrimicrobiaceae bacterium]